MLYVEMASVQKRFAIFNFFKKMLGIAWFVLDVLTCSLLSYNSLERVFISQIFISLVCNGMFAKA